MNPDSSARRRHVWIDGGGGGRYPGLVLCWRRSEDTPQLWEAQVAIIRRASVLTTWVPAADLRPLADDQAELPRRTP